MGKVCRKSIWSSASGPNEYPTPADMTVARYRPNERLGPLSSDCS